MILMKAFILLIESGKNVSQTEHQIVTVICFQSIFLTFESSCCVLSSSSAFLVLISVVWMSSSLFTERGSLSEAVVLVASLRSGGEELREV